MADRRLQVFSTVARLLGFAYDSAGGDLSNSAT